nr:MAG TPA: hypothetical protein [Microviridae sp.]
MLYYYDYNKYNIKSPPSTSLLGTWRTDTKLDFAHRLA